MEGNCLSQFIPRDELKIRSDYLKKNTTRNTILKIMILAIGKNKDEFLDIHIGHGDRRTTLTTTYC